MTFDEMLAFAGSGLDQTNLLITFTLLDSVLGLSLHLRNHQPLISNTFLSGVTRNFVPALLPALLQMLHDHLKSTTPAYQYAEFFIFISTGYFLLQSIMANLNGLGTPLPKWLTKWISNELNEKGLK